MLIEHIDRETGDVMTLESVMHGFEDGDFISFSEVKGMNELNHIDAVQITVKSMLHCFIESDKFENMALISSFSFGVIFLRPNRNFVEIKGLSTGDECPESYCLGMFCRAVDVQATF